MSKLPATMTAIAIREPGGPEVLVPEQRPLPVLGDGEILIQVEAAGVNRPDVMQRRGLYPPPPGAPDIPGLEIAGVVVARAADVTRWKLGERVAALVAGGGYATYCKAHESHVLALPPTLTTIEAAAIPETFMTVWHNVFQRGALRSGEWLLVHGGTSGIGTTAIQLAAAQGSRVIATAGSDEKCQACLSLGATLAINYRTADFVKETRSITEGHGADVVLDMIGGDYVDRNYEAAAIEGRIVQIASQAGAKATVNIGRLMQKRLHHTGSTLRARTIEDKAAIAKAVQEHAMPLVGTGRVKPVIDSTFPLAEAAAAHARMEQSVHIGKIVLTI